MSDKQSTPSGQATFSTLVKNKELLAALTEKGFQIATAVQEITIPAALNKEDLVINAQTGSGKTLAFAIPMLSLLSEASKKHQVDYTFGFIVSPTRELAQQIAEVIQDLLPDLSPCLLIGGVPYPKQLTQLKKDPRIVVGTPGRILDAISRKDLNVRDCKFFVLDEADEMFSMGFYEAVEEIISYVPEPAQGLFVSATISPRVKMLAQKFLKKPKFLEAESEDDDAPPIDHYFCNVGGGVSDKPSSLCDLIEHIQPESAIIFCNTKSETELVEVFLRRRGFDARRINSDLNQNQRTKVMEKIKAKELRFLVATDIAARGIDIKQIELVVNFSLHDTPETYVHRTGRTGRAGNKGSAISLVSPGDFMAFKMVKRDLPIDFKEMKLPSEEELAEARYAHLKLCLKDARKPSAKPDIVLAKKIIQKMGGSAEISSELENFIADMAEFTLKHVVNEKAESLDEELKKAIPAKRGEDSGNRGSRNNRDGNRNRGRDNRGNSQRNNRRRRD
ncbi:MAG: DEAD/DEAH box helicase [Bdellovibrionota bacterium]